MLGSFPPPRSISMPWHCRPISVHCIPFYFLSPRRSSFNFMATSSSFDATSCLSARCSATPSSPKQFHSKPLQSINCHCVLCHDASAFPPRNPGHATPSVCAPVPLRAPQSLAMPSDSNQLIFAYRFPCIFGLCRVIEVAQE